MSWSILIHFIFLFFFIYYCPLKVLYAIFTHGDFQRNGEIIKQHAGNLCKLLLQVQ